MGIATPGVVSPRKQGRGRAAPLLGLILLLVAALFVAGLLVWQVSASGGVPDPMRQADRSSVATVDIAVLVFREGLESILVLAALTASMVGASGAYRRPVAAGVGLGIAATLMTWFIAVRAIDGLSSNMSALHVQAITGLIAIVVLLVVMNWFFHKLYWSGWISLHTRRKRALLKDAGVSISKTRLLWGLVLLGFTSIYREGFEVVLFLQTYRLQLGTGPVLHGVLLGSLLTAIVAVLTFAVHHRLPYRQMLIATGVLLGVVLLVMVGEQAQEMQLAHWLPTTPIHALTPVIPAWVSLWFAVFPTVETLAAQAIATLLVLGSYAVVMLRLTRAASNS